MNALLKGNPDDPKSEAFLALYALALKTGKKRFGSKCKHEQIREGRCLNCKRKVKHIKFRATIKKATS